MPRQPAALLCRARPTSSVLCKPCCRLRVQSPGALPHHSSILCAAFLHTANLLGGDANPDGAQADCRCSAVVPSCQQTQAGGAHTDACSTICANPEGSSKPVHAIHGCSQQDLIPRAQKAKHLLIKAQRAERRLPDQHICASPESSSKHVHSVKASDAICQAVRSSLEAPFAYECRRGRCPFGTSPRIGTI